MAPTLGPQPHTISVLPSSKQISRNTLPPCLTRGLAGLPETRPDPFSSPHPPRPTRPSAAYTCWHPHTCEAAFGSRREPELRASRAPGSAYGAWPWPASLALQCDSLTRVPATLTGNPGRCGGRDRRSELLPPIYLPEHPSKVDHPLLHTSPSAR